MKKYKVTLAAGANSPLAISGNSLRILSAGGSVKIRFQMAAGSDIDTELVAGLAVTLPDGFVSADLFSTGGDVVEFLAGYGSSDDSRITGQVSTARSGSLNDLADVSAVATNRTQIAPANAARYALVIRNNDAASAIRVGGLTVAANAGITIEAGQTYTLETSAAVHVWNATGAPVLVSATELI